MLDWIRQKQQEAARLLLSDHQRRIYENAVREFNGRVSCNMEATFPGRYYIAFYAGGALYYVFSYTYSRIIRVAKKVRAAGGDFTCHMITPDGEIFNYSEDEDLMRRQAKNIGWDIFSVL